MDDESQVNTRTDEMDEEIDNVVVSFGLGTAHTKQSESVDSLIDFHCLAEVL